MASKLSLEATGKGSNSWKKSVAAMHYRTAFTTFPEYEVTLAAALQRHQYRENTAAHSCSKSS